MIKDYSAAKASNKVSAKKTPFKKAPKWLLPFLLLFILVAFLLFALQNEFRKVLSLAENQRLLLIQKDQPVAILSFRVDGKQLLVTDLRSSDLKLEISPVQSRNLIYSFALGTVFDEVYDYPLEDLSKNSLLNFFKNKRPYYLFLKHPSLLIREQQFNGDLPILNESFFDCPVALINTTPESGLASSLASVLQKSAFSIVKKDSNQDDLNQTKIVYDPQVSTCAKVLDKLSKFLPNSLLESDTTATTLHRSAVVIYIGKDLTQMLPTESEEITK